MHVTESWCGITVLYVSHDQTLKTPFIAPIPEHKHVLSSDGQKFLPWGEFREYCNFYISLIVFHVQIML